MLITGIEVIVSSNINQVIRKENEQYVLDFNIEEYLEDKELKSFLLEVCHNSFSTYLTNKTDSINQTLRSTTALLIGFIYYKPLIKNQEIIRESSNEKHILILEDISLLSSLNRTHTNIQIDLP